MRTVKQDGEDEDKDDEVNGKMRVSDRIE